MATDDKSSPTLESASELPRSPSSPSHLTHFKPLTPDQDDPPFKSAYSSFVNLFRFNKDEVRTVSATDRSEPGPSDHAVRNTWSSPHLSPTSQPVKFPVQYKKQLLGERRSSTSSETRRKPEPPLGHDPRTAVQLRSLSTVVKRLKEIMEGKSQDSDLKQYWMPDSQCKECYDCNEKFTTFRRRHHCRLCGQIFCSRCCNQEIPGKFMGYTGDLRACTYCCKIAINYAHSTDGHTFGEDLNALSDSSCSVSLLDPGEPRTPVGGRKSSRNIFLEEDLAWQSLVHQESSKPSRLASVQEDAGKSPARNRSASITNLSLDRSGSPMVPAYESSVSPQASRTYLKNDTNEDERKILLDSVQLKELWKKICHHNSGMEFQDHRYWLRTYPNCIVGKELVNWLIRNGHVTTRAQAIAIGQALVDGRWLDCVTHHDQLFRDEYALYRPLQSTEFSETPSPDSDSVNSVEGHSEPSWFKDIKFDDSDTEQIVDEGEDNLTNSTSPSKRTSVSSFQSAMDSDSAASISLNVEMDNVNFHIKKHSKYPHVPPHPADQKEFLLSEDGGQQMISISDAFIKESLFNRRVEEKSKDLPFTPLGWHHNTLDQLREENGEKQAMERLLSANHSHMMYLLQQLLYNESLSLSWRDIIVPVVCQVVQTVRPDVKNDDDMDIRQYVHIKKIPGGKKADSMVVNGFVCTKNIAHKKMNASIKSPKILLLKCSIEYLYREETKFTCIDPIVLQEREFLKNYVQRIVDVRPTLVLVEKTVSRIAQDMLLEHGITLAINVKPQVLDRVSRMTQGDLVMSMDQLLTKPRLGTCNKFYIQMFPLPNDESKTLMFFEGCPQHLGCTIKLSGASEYELARVKDIIIFMVYAAYHSQLEISFLMDEFAMPPTLPKSSSFRSLIEGHEGYGSQKDLFNGEECSSINWESDRSSERLHVISESQSSENLEFMEQRSCFEETGELGSRSSETSSSALPDLPILLSNSSLLSSVSIEPELFTQMCLIPGISKDDEVSQKFEEEEEPKNEHRLFRDPLQDDTGLYITEEVTSTDDCLKVHSIAFKQELKDVILGISPIISFKEPFLLTEKGMRCPTRDYFPEQVYISPLLNKEMKEMESRRKKQLLRELSNMHGINGSDPGKTIEVLPSHELLSTKIAEHLGDSQNLARILADYRARGGRIRQKDVDPFVQTKETPNGLLNKHEVKYDSEEDKGISQNEMSWNSKIDCLSVLNHQRLCVLFSSSSAQSSNAPSACVSPWIVTMEFYGKNDLTLGVFLERYCFRPSYQCPSVFCDTPMVHHIRRFVHGNGCVQIILKELDSPVPGYQHTILTYSWCRICQQVTPVVPLSNESWSMSFAKYLELRFYGNQYTRRANAEPCGHSIHHNYHQYFSYNQMVASFSYSSIRLLEVCVPMPKIYIKQHTPAKVSILHDLKDFSQKVTQVYSSVDDRLTSLKTDTFNKTREEKMEDLFAKKEMEEVELRNWIQARMLCSNMDTPQQLQSVFESIIVKKQSLCENLQAWNNRLQDLFQQEKGRKRPSVPASPGRMRQGEEPKGSGMDASPRNSSPAQNGDKEDRFMTTLSQSSTGSTHLQIPSPPELAADQVFTTLPNTTEMDTASSCEDVFDGHLLGSTDSQVKEKSTMKAIFANLLPGNNYNPIPLPFDPDKHYLMYEHERVPIAVCEKEPSSIIAFALSCKEYRNALDDLSTASLKICPEEGALPSNMMDNRPKTSSPSRVQESSLAQSNHTAEPEPQSTGKKASGVLSFFRGTGGKSPDLSAQRKETLRGADSAYYQVGQMGREGAESQGAENQDDADGGDKQKKQSGNPHVELQFSDANAKFYCRIYYAGEFHRMRKVILGSNEEDFIRSLAHCVPWQARGGKSGAAFYATEDDRFILKQMPRLEVQSFLDFAPHYFTYITNAVQMKRPTALAKILGVYRIGYKNSQNNTEKKLDLLVMENLFYGRKMGQVFDLKGSLRNRNVKTDIGKESCDLVLLDENLLKMVRDNPLYIRSHSKSVLRASIHSDSHFLSSHLIIDYSLLVGRDDTTDELVVGIIDYIRTFTWDKKLEMVVKSTGILGGQGKMPTVVSPELYRTRFCEAMDKYFLMVPDHWTGLGGNC
ncbi:1-phosphatidylinositol 3-phosphate 5-kinase isoform X2 [Hyla sarda]|uniref:1-phosphatidylinositol 3-phosphate 5-kinase isoform X2 n=1 Tax=Hyla sarda TaxID=327740 RepID=UPI0024C37EEF|nr:1-phosphatidylinositol 3-phosphate 5-kinase isoform X2 [Hyla sarda]